MLRTFFLAFQALVHVQEVRASQGEGKLTMDDFLTNRFHVALRLFINRSQMTPKCGKNKKVRLVLLMFLQHFDVFCDLLLNRRTVTWKPFVLYNKEAKVVNGDVIYASVLQ